MDWRHVQGELRLSPAGDGHQNPSWPQCDKMDGWMDIVFSLSCSLRHSLIQILISELLWTQQMEPSAFESG